MRPDKVVKATREINETEAHLIIKAMRIYLGMTQQEIANKVGIAYGLYNEFKNLPGKLLKGRFQDVYRILEVLHLNPGKFLQGDYELSKIGRLVAIQKVGRINHIQLRMIRNNCPVTLKGGKDNG